MAAEGEDIVTFIFTGEEERDEYGYYIIPQDATHLIMHESIVVIPTNLFRRHPNIVEVYCHAGVIRIEMHAFTDCPRLRRLIIPGVKVVEEGAFCGCEAMTDIECLKLEIVGHVAFADCKSLSSINLPSARDVGGGALVDCTALTDVKFGKHLESMGGAALCCPSLERITIPLKNGLFTADNIFQCCDRLRGVDLVEREALYDTIAALHLEEWRSDMNAEIDSITQILPNANPGNDEYGEDEDEDESDVGEKVIVIRDWITRVLRKIIRYKAQHRHVLNEAATTLRITFPNEIVTSNVIPFLELPEHTFEGEGDDTM